MRGACAPSPGYALRRHGAAEMAALSAADVASALSEPDPSTKDYMFQQTMLRIKDPKCSLDFYTRVLGMR